uniref:Uncharacterized protein n=1 Tax=Picea glauca TaxID=3330 RepID=A0A101LZL1_PICGL|nr:hypothetical protein ABT39_MTgene5250 [Picea glauca]
MLRVDPDLDLRFNLQRVELQWDPLPWGKLMLGFERARMLPLRLPPMPLYRPLSLRVSYLDLLLKDLNLLHLLLNMKKPAGKLAWDL